ncbi:TRAP transporter small permease [Sutterella massiliensis]
MIDFLKKLDEGFSKAVRIICTILMAMIFIMFILNVFVRFVPVYNFTQTDDWIQICLIWMIFLGAQELVRTRNHFVVDFLADRIKNRQVKLALQIVVCLIELATYAVIAWFGFVWVIKSNSYMQSIPWMQVRWMYLAIPVSATFMTLYAVRDLILTFQGKRL